MDERDERDGNVERGAVDESPDTIWEGLLSGHFSLIELIEHAGSTYLVARKNEPRGPALTFRERTCVAWAGRGLNDGEVAREMKLPVSTVSVHLANAAQKLGVSSRSALVSAASAFVDVET
jgi:DNA-binding CsgD family transcriptional regulator